MAEREGVGAALADGVEAARLHFGIEDDSFSMHAKGMELGGYDPRGVKGQALVFSAGPRGGCHHAGGYVVMEEVVSGKWDRFATQGKGAMVRRVREFRMVIDSAIYCAFQGAGLGLEGAARLHQRRHRHGRGRCPTCCGPPSAAATWRGPTTCGSACGATGTRCPAACWRSLIPAGPSAGHTVDLQPLLDELYADCGWDRTTGIPTAERLRALGLDDIAADLAM